MDIKTRLIDYEGSRAYQTRMGYFRNNKYYPYKDSEGFLTVGFGHKVLQGDNFNNGITEVEALHLLDKDIAIAENHLSKLNLIIPKDWQDFMIIMIFQLGLSGTMKFKKMIQALRDANYPEAIKQAKDSLWYRQTPNRVNAMIAQLTNK
ncbi:glycoside hydrolase family protein [Enterobacter ludwigii]|uniref:glycoside hydrolase family protein n=1 Tax=Enterobacter ludwigii TaxID=299767 RepID=UPI002B10CFA8|nr:glycoside hydrolase family protein [Enterobacter ludwigii]WRM14450.1 glycoside hydrolase family protein [Enterobacter ludwigii]HEP0986940.1 glycoside hydrolase family protein [Enterobacter ludwigii]